MHNNKLTPKQREEILEEIIKIVYNPKYEIRWENHSCNLKNIYISENNIGCIHYHIYKKEEKEK